MSIPIDSSVHVLRPDFEETLLGSEFLYRPKFEAWLKQHLKQQKETALAVHAGQEAAKQLMQDTARLKDQEIKRLEEGLRQKGTQSEDLKRENDLLTRENDLLKRENDLLKLRMWHATGDPNTERPSKRPREEDQDKRP